MENFKIAYSDLKDADAAVKSIREQLSDMNACLVLYFASPSYPAEIICKEMSDAFTGVHTLGCTTAGEMVSGKMGQDTIVAMAWHKASLKHLDYEILENIDADMEGNVHQAFQTFEKSLGKPMKELNPSQFVGIIMVDGLSGCEEKLNDQLGNLTNVPFVGGSAGDNFKFKTTWLFADGKMYTNAAILLLIEPTNGYEILKTQSFTTTDKKLTPTKVDEKRRMIIEFDGKPATEAYADVLDISVDELNKTLGKSPVGLVFDEQNFFVRSPMKIEGTSIVFYCSVKEGLELTVLHSDDIVSRTRADLTKAAQNCRGLKAVVDFNCCLRTLELTQKNQLQDYSEIFGNIPAIGFATYGESYIGHINQTSTMLLLK